MKKEDLRPISYRDTFSTDLKEGYFHKWIGKDALIELNNGIVLKVKYHEIIFLPIESKPDKESDDLFEEVYVMFMVGLEENQYSPKKKFADDIFKYFKEHYILKLKE